MNKKLIFIISIILVLFIMLIKSNKNSNNKKSTKISQKIYRNKLRVDLSNLKRISFIRKIFDNINETISDTNYIFIYYDGSCKGCIKLGKKLITQIDNFPIYNFYLTKKISNKYRGMTNYIKNDSINYYLNKINYIKTPIILKFDSTYTVLDAFWPGVNNDSEFKKFIE